MVQKIHPRGVILGPYFPPPVDIFSKKVNWVFCPYSSPWIIPQVSTINQIASSTYRDTHKGISNLQLQTREANKKIEAAADLQKSIPGKHTIISAISFAKLTRAN